MKLFLHMVLILVIGAAGTEQDPCEPTSGSGTAADPFVFNATLNYHVSSTG